MPDRMPESGGSLARQGATGTIGDRPGYKNRHPQAALFENRLDRKNRRLGIQGIEYRFHHQAVDTAFEQSMRRNSIGVGELFEGDIAQARVIDIRRHRRGAIGWAKDAGDKSLPAALPGDFIRCLPGDARRGQVEIGNSLFKAIVRLRRETGVEGIGLDNIRAGLEIGLVDFPDDMRPGQAQQVIVAGQRLVVAFELPPAEVSLGQTVVLDHRAHRTIEQQDSLAQRFFKRMHAQSPVAA